MDGKADGEVSLWGSAAIMAIVPRCSALRRLVLGLGDSTCGGRAVDWTAVQCGFCAPVA